MDRKVFGALVLLVVWAVAALVFEAPGWVHLLLTVGVSLLIFAIVSRSDTADEGNPPPDAPRRS